MKLKKGKLIVISFISLLLIVLIFNFSLKLINNTSGFSQKIKYFFPQSFRDLLRETVYKSNYLEIENVKLNQKLNKVFENDVSFKEKKISKISHTEIKSKEDREYLLTKFSYPYYEHFSWGKKPPGYLAEYKNYIITMSGSGEIIFFKKSEINNDKLSFNFLNTNFYTFIDINKYYMV